MEKEIKAKKYSENVMGCTVANSCPGAGACGGMYTANTMASAIEAMGMALPYSATRPADSTEKLQECLQTGPVIRRLLERDIKPRDIMTRDAFENAMVVITALGGSTNAVLHLIAMARSVDVDLTIDDFQKVSDRVPLLADMKPSGSFVQEDLHDVGGIPALMKLLLEEDLLKGDCLTVTGNTIADNLNKTPGFSREQTIIRPLKRPIKDSGHIQILRGNLAPDGAVAKITGKEGCLFRVRPTYLIRRRKCWRLWKKAKFKKAIPSSSATKAPKADRACRKC
jgi:dihydroxy-acid dehydratase